MGIWVNRLTRATAASLTGCMICLASAFAQTPDYTTAGYISQVYPTNWGMVYFQHSGTRATRPACATQNRWVINMSNSGGQAMLSALLTAYASAKPITIVGTGDCRDWPDTESIVYFTLP